MSVNQIWEASGISSQSEVCCLAVKLDVDYWVCPVPTSVVGVVAINERHAILPAFGGGIAGFEIHTKAVYHQICIFDGARQVVRRFLAARAQGQVEDIVAQVIGGCVAFS